MHLATSSMKLLSFLGLVSLSHALSTSQANKKPSELIVLRDADAHCKILSFRETQLLRGVDDNTVHTTRLATADGGHRVSYVSYNVQAVWDKVNAECSNELTERGWVYAEGVQHVLGNSEGLGIGVPPPELQVSPLVVSGPSANRVDLVFFSDGYLASEYDKFINDAKTLAEDISSNHTFNTVKPLLNFWAAFTPSKESGVGAGGEPLDTVYGLYRPGTELRGVLYSKPEVARAACLSLGDKCDYPILIGNDPLYGGLGGEFTVITPSIANGALVLRHELGHSIIDVGEEYDGAEDWDHFGVNSHPNLTTPVTWAHWLTNSSSSASVDEVRAERSVMPLQSYAWSMLNTSTEWSAKFPASGQYARHLVRFSLSGLPEEADLTVELDGEDLGWTPKVGLGVDRWHYDIYRDGGLGDGEHEVKFKLNNAEREGIAQLCSIEVLEFGDERQFNATPGHYSLYPTFSDKNETYYRPTNEDCLMRIVTTPDFCSVCQEDLWLKLLKRVDLIDDIDVECTNTASDVHSVNLKLAPLAELREVPVPEKESWLIKWYDGKSGKVLDTLTNKTAVELGEGEYAVDVQFFTEEIRVDKEGLTMSTRKFDVGQRC